MNSIVVLALEPQVINIIDIVFTCIVALCAVLFILIKLKRKFVIISYLVIFALYLLSLFVKLPYLSDVLQVVVIVFSLMCVFENVSEYRSLMSNFSTTHRRDRRQGSTDYNKEELYEKINEAIHLLSRSKTGALLTFEKSQNMNELIKNGTVINAPVTVELLQTIFYPGTRLHDGAIVIRGNIIVAASVYYTPTTRALTGKYGSRHRAAFGISEITDSVTVVVSEETGRVSIAYMGKLEPVSLDEFLDEFVDLMSRD